MTEPTPAAHLRDLLHKVSAMDPEQAAELDAQISAAFASYAESGVFRDKESMERRRIACHLVWISPGNWHVVSTVLRPEQDPVDLAYEPTLDPLNPFETAITVERADGVTDHAVTRHGGDREDARRFHYVVLGPRTRKARVVTDLGLRIGPFRPVASDIEAVWMAGR